MPKGLCYSAHVSELYMLHSNVKKTVKAVHEVFWQVSYPAPEETEVYFSARNEVSPLGQEFMVVSELVVDESSTARFRSYFTPFNTGTQANAHRRTHGHTLIAVRGSCSRTDGHLSDRCKHGRDTNQLAVLNCLTEQCVNARLTIFISSHIRLGTPAGSEADYYCISFRYNG